MTQTNIAAPTPGRHGVTFTKESLDKAVKDVDNNPVYGFMAPFVLSSDLNDISHKVTNLAVDVSGVITGTITCLETPKGKILRQLIETDEPDKIAMSRIIAINAVPG